MPARRRSSVHSLRRPRLKYHYIAFYKPYGVVSQFSAEHPSQHTLADYLDLPKDIYPIGRLDKDSEGLLLLTNDNRFKHTLLDPQHKVPKRYLCQLEGDITDEAIHALQRGVHIVVRKKPYRTLPAEVRRIEPPDLPERQPPIRYRKSVPTSWIAIVLREGKNRQIRKMCARVGFPVLRLIRVGVGNYTMQGLLPGQWIHIRPDEVIDGYGG